MSIGKVSFGKVIAVTGPEKKIRRINQRLAPKANAGGLMMKDVTAHYRNACTYGALAQAVENGESVEIYITGDDIQKVKQRQNGWVTINGILSNLDSYLNVSKMSVWEAADKILNFK